MATYRIEIEDDDTAQLFRDGRFVQEFDEIDDAERYVREREGRGTTVTVVDVDGYRSERKLR